MMPRIACFSRLLVLVAICVGSFTLHAQDCAWEFDSDTILFCTEAPVLNAPEGFESYEWSTGEQEQVIMPEISGSYEITMTSGSPFQNSHSLSLNSGQRALGYDWNGELTPSSLTLIAQFKATAVDGRRMIAVKKSASCSKWDAFSLFLENGRLKGRLMIGPCAGGCWCNVPDTEDFIEIDGGEVSLNTWYQVAMTWEESAGLMKVYVNGTLVSSFQKDDTLVYIDPTEPFVIGASDVNGAMDDEFSGYIDNVSVWSVAMSASDIADLADCPPLPDTPSLLALWRFDEGEGSLAGSDGEVDLSLDLENATYSSDIPLESCSGCSVSDQVMVLLIQPDEVFPEVVRGCEGQQIQIFSLMEGIDILWPDGSVGESWQTILEQDDMISVQVAGQGSTCSAEIAIDIADVSVNVNTSPVSCFGLDDGQVSFDISGDFPPFNLNEFNVDLEMLEGGKHVVEVSDNQNCTFIIPFEISEPEPLMVDMEFIQPVCSTETGGINLAIVGGTPDCAVFSPHCYDFDWSSCNGVTDEGSPSQTGLSEGIYCAVVTDGNGCQKEITIELDQSATCGCTYEEAVNFDNAAFFDDGSCTFQDSPNSCPSDLNDDQQVNASDLLMFLVGFGEACSP